MICAQRSSILPSTIVRHTCLYVRLERYLKRPLLFSVPDGALMMRELYLCAHPMLQLPRFFPDVCI